MPVPRVLCAWSSQGLRLTPLTRLGRHRGRPRGSEHPQLGHCHGGGTPTSTCPRASWGHSRHTQLTGHPAVISGDTSPDMARDLNSNLHPTRSRTMPGRPLLPAEPKSAQGRDWGVNLEARQPGGPAWGWGAASVPSPGRCPQKPRLQTHPVHFKTFRAGDWIQLPAGPCLPEGAAPVMGPCSSALRVV